MPRDVFLGNGFANASDESKDSPNYKNDSEHPQILSINPYLYK